MIAVLPFTDMVLRKPIKYLSVYHQLREIALPRPLPNPPEYVEPPRASLLTGGFWKRIHDGLSSYADTWKSLQEEPQGKMDQHEMELEAGSTRESKMGAASSVIQYQYGIRMRALQIALGEFVKGFHEGSRQ